MVGKSHWKSDQLTLGNTFEQCTFAQQGGIAHFKIKPNYHSVLPLFCKSSTFDSSIGLACGVKYVKRHVHFDRFSSILVQKIADMKAEVMILIF